MRAIPPYAKNNESKAEIKIFNLLKGLDESEGFFVHSLNLPEHDYKQWAEADFVVVMPKGIMILEVKGGGVSRENGIWKFTNRYGNVNKKHESPLDQAKGARFSLSKRLEDLIPNELLSRINFGFAVMFPDTIFDAVSVEWDKQLVFDAKDMNQGNLPKWLSNLVRYWSQKTKRETPITKEDLSTILQAIRPDFDRVPALISRVGDTVEELIRLTENQYRILDGLLLRDRVVIEGGAGTGKTFLALEAAKRKAATGKTVAYMCRSPALAWTISQKVQSDSIKVLNYETIKELVKLNRPPVFDYFIIDEGQDFLTMEDMSFIDSVIEGGIENGKWLFFMDSNNQSSMYEKYDPDAKEYLESAGLPWPLFENCRNTRQIAEETLMLTGGDIGLAKVVGEGLKVDYQYYDGTSDGLSAIEKKLSEWVDLEHVIPGEISILSMKTWDDSCIKGINKRWRRNIQILNPLTGTEQNKNSVLFSSVVDYKGLENKYILLVDLDDATLTEEFITKLYVGMTRANAVACLVMSESKKGFFKKLTLSNFNKLASV